MVTVAVELIYFETDILGPAAAEDPMLGGD